MRKKEDEERGRGGEGGGGAVNSKVKIYKKCNFSFNFFNAFDIVLLDFL